MKTSGLKTVAVNGAVNRLSAFLAMRTCFLGLPMNKALTKPQSASLVDEWPVGETKTTTHGGNVLLIMRVAACQGIKIETEKRQLKNGKTEWRMTRV